MVITRHKHPVVELRAVSSAPGPITNEALDWLAERRSRQPLPSPTDSGALVSQIRDEWDQGPSLVMAGLVPAISIRSLEAGD